MEGGLSARPVRPSPLWTVGIGAAGRRSTSCLHSADSRPPAGGLHNPIWTTQRHATLRTSQPSASSDSAVAIPIYRVIPTLPGQGGRELPPLALGSASLRLTETNCRMRKGGCHDMPSRDHPPLQDPRAG